MNRTHRLMEALEAHAPAILRIGLGLMFLWFGYDQFAHTSNWIDFVPQSIVDMTGVSARLLVLANGVFELVGATALILGCYTRLFALLLGLHLADITFIVGFTALGVRDFGLTVATLAVWMLGSGPWSFDRSTCEKKEREGLGQVFPQRQ